MKNFYYQKNVLITGGAGFIGSHLVKELVKLDAKVTVIDNLSRGNLKRLESVYKKITFYKADLTNEKEAQPFFLGQEIIFNLAALNTGVVFDLGRTELMFEENLLLQMMPLRMSKKSKTVKKFVQISTASVYSRKAMEEQVPTPENADTAVPEPSKMGYALAKRIGEQLACWYYQNTGIETINVRFINVFGENDNHDKMGHFIPVMVRKFIEEKNEVNVFGSGKQRRSFIYVGDAVNALLLLAKKGVAGETYNVDSNNEKSIKEVVDEIESYFKEKKLKIYFDLSKPEGSKRRMLDSSKLQRLGWNAKTSFSEGLKKTIDNIKKDLD